VAAWRSQGHAHTQFMSASKHVKRQDAVDAERFDVILTDPPYGIDAQDFGDAGGRLVSQTHEYSDVGGEAWETLMLEFARQSFRIAKAQAHAYICCDIDKPQKPDNPSALTITLPPEIRNRRQ